MNLLIAKKLVHDASMCMDNTLPQPSHTLQCTAAKFQQQLISFIPVQYYYDYCTSAGDQATDLHNEMPYTATLVIH